MRREGEGKGGGKGVSVCVDSSRSLRSAGFQPMVHTKPNGCSRTQITEPFVQIAEPRNNRARIRIHVLALEAVKERQRDRDRETDRDRQRDGDRETDRERQRDGERDREMIGTQTQTQTQTHGHKPKQREDGAQEAFQTTRAAEWGLDAGTPNPAGVRETQT